MLEIVFCNDLSTFRGDLFKKAVNDVDGLEANFSIERQVTREEVKIRVLDESKTPMDKSEVSDGVISNIVKNMEDSGFTHLETVDVERDIGG